MEIVLKGLSKRFSGQWLFKNLDHHFTSPGVWAITGPNGSGKTTLLQVISGMIPPSEGTVNFRLQNTSIEEEAVYRHLWLAAPYMELLEELTLKELLEFHFRLKPKNKEYSISQIAQCSQLVEALDKPVNKFSSGMKQRVKLALGIFSDIPVLLMDEPTTNLDASGCKWYKESVTSLAANKLVIISSNQPHEYDFCQNILDMSTLK